MCCLSSFSPHSSYHNLDYSFLCFLILVYCKLLSQILGILFHSGPKGIKDVEYDLDQIVWNTAWNLTRCWLLLVIDTHFCPVFSPTLNWFKLQIPWDWSECLWRNTCLCFLSLVCLVASDSNQLLWRLGIMFSYTPGKLYFRAPVWPRWRMLRFLTLEKNLKVEKFKY